jgi:bifunctional DNA-binding transcriptional regulator/antitoxin component of YhaV-PrlF toxin-antitoxin module
MASQVVQDVQLSDARQLIVPEQILDALHWQPGQELTLVASGDGLTVVPKRRRSGFRLEELRGRLRVPGIRVSDRTLCAPVDYRGDWEKGEDQGQ